MEGGELNGCAMEEYVKIWTDSAIVVNRVVQVLEEEGIPSRIRDHVESARLAGFGVTPDDVELHVLKKDIMQAKKIVSSFFEDTAPS